MATEPEKSEQDPAFGRRTFLRHSLVSLGATVQEFVKHRDAPRIQNIEQKPVLVKKGWLRPPGAISNDEFLDRCTKCGDCVDVCPNKAIQPSLEDGTPVIFAEEAACRLCEDLPCISACGTEALIPLPHIGMVDMGLAVVSPSLCTAGNGCNSCVSKCPVEALSMDFGMFCVKVDGNRCVGCGVCQYVCATVNDRAAIRVVSKHS
jgi:ferredoxin-type protein NapG